MNMEEIIRQARYNIELAIEDYGMFAETDEVLRDIKDDFIYVLAEDSSHAKQELRELFSKSPNWDPKLDAIVVDGTKIHDTDYNHVSSLVRKLVEPALKVADDSRKQLINQAIDLFCNPPCEESASQSIEAINTLAPNAYVQGKKLSRVLKALCAGLGIANEEKGSEFQKLYAQAADEMNTKPIDFKLFISINPAHFLTMSNPKNDGRGDCLTSCHSLNDSDYEYNNGCSGYARDKTSFIVFTVDDPLDLRSLNNRKTTRQIFAYKPGNGVLLQSRMYNTSGGVYGAAEESRLYRNIVQHEISELENAPNLWKTGQATSEKYADAVKQHPAFGGYADWEYKDFDAHISIRTDHTDDWQPILVGNAGLCIHCGGEISRGLYCDDHDPERHRCFHCGEIVDEELCTAYDRDSSNDDLTEVYVCSDCLESNYAFCDSCEEFCPESCVTLTEENECVCDECLNAYYKQCDCCKTWHKPSGVIWIHGRYDKEVFACANCVDEIAEKCSDCHEEFYTGTTVTAYRKDGEEIHVCEDCAKNYDICPDCGSLVKMTNEGVCPHCGVCQSAVA